MKKMLLLLGLLVLSVLVVSCAREGAVAGEAVSSTRSVARGDLISLGGHILEYQGADASTTSPQLIRFHDWSTGETLEYAVERGLVSIRLSGETYQVQLTSSRRIDSSLVVDYEGDERLDRTHQLTYLHFSSPGINVQCPSAGLRCDDVLTLLEGETITTTAQDINGIRGEHDLLITLINSTSTRLVVDAVPETIHNRQSAVVSDLLVTA